MQDEILPVGNERAAAWTMASHCKHPAINSDRFEEAHRMYTDSPFCQPDDRVAHCCPPPLVPPHLISMAAASLLHRLRADSVFRNKTLHCIALADNLTCNACGEVQNVRHILCVCRSYSNTRGRFRHALRTADMPFSTVDSLLFPLESPNRARLVFRVFL